MPELGQLEMKARVEEILNRHAAVGLAVGVVRKGRLDFFHGHGFADMESNTPITEDTVFRIASITKTFTAIAVMQLQEQGRLDLDEPRQQLPARLPAAPGEGKFPARDGARSAHPHGRSSSDAAPRTRAQDALCRFGADRGRGEL